jgi:two-component system sensor histidine kinase YesM
MRPFRLLDSGKTYKIPRVSRLYLKLRSKFTISFFLLVMIPFFSFMAVAYFYSRTVLEKNIHEMTLINLNQEKNSIARYLKDLETSIKAFSGDSLLAELLRRNTARDAAGTDSELERAASAYFTAGQAEELSAVYILSGDKIAASYDRNNEKAAINAPSSQPWYGKALGEPSEVLVLGTTQRFYDAGRSTAVFSLAKAIESMPPGSEPAILLLDFNYSVLSDIVEPDDPPDSGEERLIIDNSGRVIYSGDPGMLTIAPEDGLLLKTDGDRGFKRTLYRDEDVYMTYARFPELPWTFISLLPVKITLEKLLPSSSPVVPVCIITVPLILLLYLVVSSRLLTPINELTSVISDYEKGNFSDGPGRQLPAAEPLAAGGAGNASEIDYLINKVYNIKLKQKEAELNSLQNQINPHFLYNTLESIRGAALYHGIHEIAAMSKALSLLFRYSISDRVLVSIKEEIQHLDNYMSIQNFRYENKFDLIYSISPELYNYKILKLTLQPLIENSIKHGLEMKLGKGLIKVEILGMDKNIKIQISDDGLGIMPKKVEELNRSLSRNEFLAANESDRAGTGIGVRNVNSRIKLYFGEQYGLKFRDALVGTTVEITLPAVKDG